MMRGLALAAALALGCPDTRTRYRCWQAEEARAALQDRTYAPEALLGGPELELAAAAQCPDAGQ